MRLQALLCVGLLGIATGSAEAFGRLERGTSGAGFLQLSPSPRAAAMGDAYSAVSDDVYSVFYNPAGLSGLKDVQIAGMHNAHFQGVSHNFAAIAVPVLAWVETRRPRNKFGVIALSMTSLSVGDIERRGVVETDSATDRFGARDFAYAVGYGVALTKSFALGGSMKFISQDIDSAVATAFAVDAGGQFSWDRFSLGAGLRNAGSAIKFRDNGDPLPITLYGGVRCAIKPGWLAAAEVLVPRDDTPQLGFGAEYRRQVGRGIEGALRLGLNTSRTGADGFAGFSAGGGLKYGRTDFDLAWIPYGELGDTLRYSMTLRF